MIYARRIEAFDYPAAWVWRRLSPEFDALYADSGRPSIAPEYILRALLLQVFYSVGSERLLVSAWAWTMRCGTMRCFPKTATGY